MGLWDRIVPWRRRRVEEGAASQPAALPEVPVALRPAPGKPADAVAGSCLEPGWLDRAMGAVIDDVPRLEAAARDEITAARKKKPGQTLADVTRLFEELARKYPASAEVVVFLAGRAKDAGDIARAQELLRERFLKVDRKSWVAETLGWLALAETGDLAAAVKWYALSWIAQRDNPINQDGFVWLANIYRALRLDEGAALLQETANRLAPSGSVRLASQATEMIESLLRKQDNAQLADFLGALAQRIAAYRAAKIERALTESQERRAAGGANCTLCGASPSLLDVYVLEKGEEKYYLADVCGGCKTVVCRSCKDSRGLALCPHCEGRLATLKPAAGG